MDDFGEYGNITTVTNATHTEGDKATTQTGNSFTGQTGDSVSRQVGNKNTFQHGYSNTLTEGMVFTTSLAATFTTTVGLAATTVAGLAIATNLAGKIAVFVGIEAAINASLAVKVTKGWAYTFDTVGKLETAAQKIIADGKKTELAVGVKRVINDEINVYAEGLDLVAGGDIKAVCKSHSTTCVGDITLDSFNKMAITGTNTLALLGGSKLTLDSFGTVTITAPAKVTVGGALINIG